MSDRMNPRGIKRSHPDWDDDDVDENNELSRVPLLTERYLNDHNFEEWYDIWEAESLMARGMSEMRKREIFLSKIQIKMSRNFRTKTVHGVWYDMFQAVRAKCRQYLIDLVVPPLISKKPDETFVEYLHRHDVFADQTFGLQLSPAGKCCPSPVAEVVIFSVVV